MITNLRMDFFEALPGVEPGDVLGAVRAPVVQAGLQRHAVGQPVRDGEAAAALQLGQHDDHLYAVDCDLGPEHFKEGTTINSPHCQEFMV